MITALADVLDTGGHFRSTTESFTSNPLDQHMDNEVYRAGSALLASLSRLLILIELAGVSTTNKLLQEVQSIVQEMTSASSSKKLIGSWNTFREKSAELLEHLGVGSETTSKLDFQDQYLQIRHTLDTNGRLLFHTSLIELHHPDNTIAQKSKEFAEKAISHSLGAMESVLDDNQRTGVIRLKVSGTLLDDIEEFENTALINVDHFDEVNTRAELERHLKRLLPSVYRLADSTETHPAQQKAVYDQCEQLKHAVTRLLNDCNHRSTDKLKVNASVQNLLNTTGDLKHLLLRISVGHVTRTVMNRNQPLMALGDATRFGNQRRLDEAAEKFQNHSSLMLNAAYELCALTSNEEVSKLVQLACTQLEQLCPHVVSAAYLLFRHPQSKSVESNFEAFQDAYREYAQFLYTQLGELTSVHDVLAVSDDQMMADFQRATRALSSGVEIEVHEASVAMHHRSILVIDVVQNKMQAQRTNVEYVDHVMEKVILLRDEYKPTFTEVSRDTMSRMAAGLSVDEMRFRHAGNNLCSAVHTVRSAVLNESELPSDLEALRLGGSNDTGASNDMDRVKTSPNPSMMSVSGPMYSPDKSALPQQPDASSYGRGVSQENELSERGELLAMLTAPERESVSQELAGFFEEKKRFMREVVKWDDSSNDVIVMAKKMCVVMMEMADFARGKGPLTSTMHVIKAAQHISEMGQHLDKLCRDVAQLCPDSSSRRDLLAYLQRITLHCHQLNITSRVKATVQNTKIGVLENSTSLIQAARNLMTAVVLTVKECYIASTKCRGPVARQPALRWQVRTVEKPSSSPDPTRGLEEEDPEDDAFLEFHPVAPTSNMMDELAQFDNTLITPRSSRLR